ncbi:MAG: MG2 domain-containing protein [Caldilineaceae bacterium]
MSSKSIFRWLIALAFVIAAGFGLRLSLSAQWNNGVNFGAGRAVQIVDPSGSNRMPIWPGQGNVIVDFTLYPLTPADFAKRMTTYDPYNNSSIDLSGLNASHTWQQSYNVNDWYAAESATLPGNVPSGIYVIQGDGGAAGKDSEYMVVSRNTLVLKKAAGRQVLVWATNLHGQSATSGMTVTLYDKDGDSLGQANTDASGVAKFTVNNGTPYIAVAQGNGETTVAGFDWQWASDGYYWWWDTGSQSGNQYTIYLYTDRPIYRPNQTIYYQAFLRQNGLSGYSQLAANTSISVTLRDARNNQIATQPATVDEFGALNGQFTIGDSPALGWWSLELTVNGQTQTQRLRVEEYRKPEYQVTVSSDKESVIAGDNAQITVAADYYFGQPVANAQVKLQIYRYTIPRYGWYWWYDYAPQPYNTAPIAELTGTTGPNGKWSTSYAPEATDQYDAYYTFSAEVTDDRNLPVVGSKQLPVYWNGFQMAVTPSKWGYERGEAVQMDVTTQNHNGSPAASKNVTVRIIRDYWDQTPESDAVAPQSGVTDGQGQLHLNFSNVPQGWFRIEATSTDGRGRKVLAVNYLWVYDPSGNDWYYSSDSELSILADKDSYAPGDTAELLIQSKIQGLALLTLERDGVYREQIVEINGPVTSVSVPIDEQLAPNVYAHLHIFATDNTSSNEWQRRREGHLVSAVKELVVPATDKELKVEISANAAKYRPADNAQLTLKVTDGSGNPVRARVSLALVDEAIYALQGDLSANLFDTFWGRRGNRVQTYDSLARQPWGYNLTPQEGATGTPAPTTTPTNDAANPGATNSAANVRRRFEDTAYWNATITTDANGQAVVNVTLPDNLTTWRVLAKAIAVDTRVGSGQSSLLVTQEIIARPALPRFAVVGDRFQAGVVTQNFSGSEASGSAEMSADHLQLLDGVAKNVTLPNAGSAAVNWTAVAARSGTGLVTSTLQTNGGGDIVELPLPVKPFAVPDRWLASGQANLAVTETFAVPLNAVTEQTQLEVRLSPSLALGVLDGLDELIDYPYGCVEQTMSRLLPSAVASKAYADLGLPNPKADELPKIVEQGLQKVYGFQHSDGSWGWFYDDSGGTFLTAYVLFGLQSVKDAGFTVDTNVVDRGFGYLDSVLSTNIEPGLRAFAQYVKALAGRGDLAATQALVSQVSVMDASQIASLALALHLNGDNNQANSVLDTLLGRAKETATTVYWPLTGDPWQWLYWQTMASDEKNSALAVRALAQLRPNDVKLPKAVRWLLENRHGAGWSNTQATAFAILGLVDVIKNTGELQSNYSYVVKLNDQTLASGQVTPQSATQPILPIQVTGEQLLAGDNRLRIERSAGPGALYYSAVLNKQLYYDGFTPVSSQDEGLSLTRSYKLQEGTPRQDGAYNLGDLVEVTLKLQSNQDLSYVLVSDPIPAGFEVVEERMNRPSWGGYYDEFYWNVWGYNQKEAHDDRVEYFVTYLWKGEHTFTYLMRATAPGDFSVLPGTASPMYKEEVWGRSASQRVLVAPEKLAALPVLAGDFDHSCQITAFDTQLTAANFASASAQHDVNHDGVVDLRDVAAVGSWQGANCGSQPSLPGAGSGSASFAIASDGGAILVGNEMRLNVSLSALSAANADASALGGFALHLNVDPARLSFKRIEVDPAFGKVIPLVPQQQGASLVVGLYGLPANLPAGSHLATLVFSGSGVGSTPISVSETNAVDGTGREITANATGGGDVQVTGKQLWLPVISR